MKLKCKAQGKEKISYQWLKDGLKMRGQNSSSLALAAVEVCDFGCYTCQVRYVDSHGGGVTSYPAILDISPREGMSEYCMSHVVWLAGEFSSRSATNNKRFLISSTVVMSRKRLKKSLVETRPVSQGVLKLSPRSFFFPKEKRFIRNRSGYNNEIEMKFGAWTNFIVLTFLSDSGISYDHVTCHLTLALDIANI